MAVVEVDGVSYSYGSHQALRDLSLSVPEGALYALLGPNGSGKTTLLQLLMGLRRPRQGRVSLFGIDSGALTIRDRASIGYIAEGQTLPGWMRLDQLERYLAPLYPTWDHALAAHLRDRFELDPTRTIKSLSRGQHMKAALLCALAPRPQLLLMDEPFTGMDALVKDELVRGLLESAGSEGWTVLLCSHDIGELELLADWVGFLADGRMSISQSMEALRARFKRVEVVTDGIDTLDRADGNDWLSLERAGNRLTFVTSNAEDGFEARLRSHFSTAAHVDVRDATLREVFVALAKQSSSSRLSGVAA
jgi:ABC-2 type transport system ATP-binding protein